MKKNITILVHINDIDESQMIKSVREMTELADETGCDVMRVSRGSYEGTIRVNKYGVYNGNIYIPFDQWKEQFDCQEATFKEDKK
jgi:hypothetical protein